MAKLTLHQQCVALVCFALAPTLAPAQEPASLQTARDNFVQGRFAPARDLATGAIRSGANLAEAYALRAACQAALDDHAGAVADYDELAKLEPRRPELYDARGSQRFMLGQFDASIADFDRAIELRPELEAGHWKRGISYYYAGKFEEGRKQFEGYQRVDGNDVENAVWRYLCMARSDGVERARREILKIRHDARVPMMEIYSLYSGQGSEQAVMDATGKGDPVAAELNVRLFYANLYLGLYHEVGGDNRLAQEHIRTAAEQHKIAHYMWDVARVHANPLQTAADRKPRP